MWHRGRKICQDQRGISPILGGLVLLAATIVLGGVAAQAFLKFGEPVPDAQVSGILGSVKLSLKSNLTESDLRMLPIAGEPIVLREARFDLTRDGIDESIPLTAIANWTQDKAMWRAGEEVCLSGTSPGCLRPAADTIQVRLIVGNQLMYSGTHHLRAFKILPGGGVTAMCSGQALVHVVGADITYGKNGPQIPVRLNWTQNNGTTLQPLFGLQPVKTGMQWSTQPPQGAIMGVRGSANYANFNAAYSSWVGDAHVAVLKDGDAAPNVPAFGNQTSVETFLQPYVETSTKTIRLSYNEAIVLMEFNPSLTSPAADWQDAVVLLRFPGGGCVG